MDGVFNKIGLYEFFGVLLPGVIVEILLVLVKCPLIYEFNIPDSQSFQMIIFLVVGYIIGTLIQEVSSYLDEKILKMREKPTTNFLYKESGVFKAWEFDGIERFAKKILEQSKGKELGEKETAKKENETKKSAENTTDKGTVTEEDCKRLFFECKACLENKGKMQKADELDAIYSMSRNFAVISFICICICISVLYTYNINNIEIEFVHYMVLMCFILSTLLFYRRAKRYSQMRVRTIFRQYKDLYIENNNISQLTSHKNFNSTYCQASTHMLQ